MTNITLPVLTPDRIEKRQNGRRFKENGEPAFTLTAQDIHGVAIGVDISGNEVVGETEVAHCLNANDQRKVFGANQERTVLGVLRNVRSDYGKEIRSAYESGQLDISRHEFLEKEIREDGMTNTIDTVTKDNHVALRVVNATSKGYDEADIGDGINLAAAGSHTRRGRVGHKCSSTLDTGGQQGVVVEVSGEKIKDEHPGVYVQLSEDCTVYCIWYEKYQCYIAIRRLTPKECFRLQGWSDEYFERAEFVNSDSQLYKQAGNGVTVGVVKLIANHMGCGHD